MIYADITLKKSECIRINRANSKYALIMSETPEEETAAENIEEWEIK